MAAVSLENWEERIRDPKVECMSRDEMAALHLKSVKSWVLQLPQQNGKFRWFTATALAKQPSQNLHLMAFKPVLLRSDSTAAREAVCMDV